MSKFVQVERLEIIVTYQCNSFCKHCLIQPHQYQNETLSPKNARKITEEICKKYNPYSIMAFGGEPTLALDSTCEILSVAQQFQIPHRQVLSNGFWAKDRDDRKIDWIAKKLIKAGLNSLHLSVDAFHQEYIPLEIPLIVAKKMLSFGVEDVKFSPRWLISKDHINQYNLKTIEILKEVESSGLPFVKGDVIQARGNALKNFSDLLVKVDIEGNKTCQEIYPEFSLDNIRNLCVSPIGDIIICNNIIIGNALEDDIIEILESYSPHNYEDLRIILEDGLGGLKKLAEREGIELAKKPYYSICDACLHWRNQLGFTKSCKS